MGVFGAGKLDKLEADNDADAMRNDAEENRRRCLGACARRRTNITQRLSLLSSDAGRGVRGTSNHAGTAKLARRAFGFATGVASALRSLS